MGLDAPVMRHCVRSFTIATLMYTLIYSDIIHIARMENIYRTH